VVGFHCKCNSNYNVFNIKNVMKSKILIYSFSMGALFSEIIDMFLVEKFQFIAILFVVMLDTSLAMTKAYKDGRFETQKAFRSIVMLVLFWALLGTVLVIERGFPFASFLSEAVILPILVFQLISIVKNLNRLGFINGQLADKILSKIDNHKDV